MSNLYLVGMMGSGKTVTGKELAKLLDKTFVDLDQMIQKKEGLTIAEIFQKQGESHFRSLETDLLKEISRQKNQAVATGGGVVLEPDNVQMMQSSGLVVYLETSMDVLWERVRGRKGRPLLEGENPRERLVEIFHKREPHYREAGNLSVQTDGKDAATVAREIQELIQHRP